MINETFTISDLRCAFIMGTVWGGLCVIIAFVLYEFMRWRKL